MLQAWNFHHAGPAKCIERVHSERAVAYISANLSSQVVRRKTRVAHRSRFYATDACAVCIFLTDRARDYLLEVHFHISKKVLRQIAAMEADCFVRIVSVVIVPVEKRTWRSGRETKRMHA